MTIKGWETVTWMGEVATTLYLGFVCLSLEIDGFRRRW